MKIAYIYDEVYPWETGGIQKRVWELACRLSMDHDIHWYGLQYWKGESVIERNGVTLHGVTEAKNLYSKGRRSIPEAISFSAALFPFLLAEDFDIIDCQQFPYFPIFPSKIHSVARNSILFFTWHEVWGDYWYDYLGWKGIFGKNIERIASYLPDEHITVSKRTGEDALGLGISQPHYVPNGINMSKIDSISEASIELDVFFTGRLIKEKGVELLIQAINNLQTREPDIQCLITGEGPERSTLKSLINKLNLNKNITLMDFRDSYEEVLRFMKAADSFALLSKREGFGISALEALACGTPVITTNHPQNAAQDLIEDGHTGRTCQPTPEAVAAAIEDVRVNAQPEACVATAQQYDWDLIAKDAEKCYKNAIF